MKFKRLIPALAMLLVSAILLGTSTFAWFSMNTTVNATNMRVRAVAEQGILINEVNTAADTHWDNEATANQTNPDDATANTRSLLYPASTADGSTWYHAASKKSNSAASATAGTESADLVSSYETLTGLTAITAMSNTQATAGSEAKRETMGKGAAATAGYYVHYEYYLKSSSSQITLGTSSGDQNINIKSVTATATTNAGSGSTNLNKSLRVGIKLNSAFYIYAPVTGYTASYYVAADDDATAPIAGSTATATDLALLPASSANGAKVDVYIWYEGEDAGCTTDNATAITLDDINIDIAFELVTVA